MDERNAHLFTTRIEADGDVRERARVKALTLQHAGAWLNTTPNPQLGHHLSSQEFVVCLKYRLGLPIYPVGTLCSLCKAKDHEVVMDQEADHAQNCIYGGGRVGRHNTIRDIIASTAQAASLSPRVEAKGLIAGSGRRPGDITLPGYPVGMDTLLDVTVVNPVQAKYRQEAAVTKGVAMEGAKKGKRQHYAGQLEANMVFRPVAFETFGGWDDDSVIICRRIASILARNQGKDEGQQARHLVQRVAMAIQKGNATMIIARLPEIESELIDGDI